MSEQVIESTEPWDLARQIGAMDEQSAQVALLSLRLALLELIDHSGREVILAMGRSKIDEAYRRLHGPEAAPGAGGEGA